MILLTSWGGYSTFTPKETYLDFTSSWNAPKIINFSILFRASVKENVNLWFFRNVYIIRKYFRGISNVLKWTTCEQQVSHSHFKSAGNLLSHSKPLCQVSWNKVLIQITNGFKNPNESYLFSNILSTVRWGLSILPVQFTIFFSRIVKCLLIVEFHGFKM